MASRSLPKRAATFAAVFGVTALAGTAPAFAASVAGQNLYGSGSSLQALAQDDIWGPSFTLPANTHRRAGLTNRPSVTYTTTSSGQGLAEFGNSANSNCDNNGPVSAGVLNPLCDSTAQGSGDGPLDGFVGSDDPPTGPLTTSGSQLYEANQASGGVNELTIPVAQAPVAILLSLPSAITLGANTKIHLTTAELNNIWDENVQASTNYGANTWGALLQDAGLARVKSAPAAQEFTDSGTQSGNTGGYQGITLQARSSGSGTSYTFKGYLYYASAASYPITYENDANSGPSGWPFDISTTTCDTQPGGSAVIDEPAGNSGGGGLVQDTAGCPGSVGYANLADAANASNGGFTGKGQASTFGSSPSHDILYAFVQDNQGATKPIYASPAVSGDNNEANVYAGNEININEATPTNAGHWFVPYSSGTTFDPTGTWGGTNPSDPDVEGHDGGDKTYPIVAATYDLAWQSYDVAGSNLAGANGYTSLANSNAVGATTKSYMTYLTSPSQGQDDLVTGGHGIAPLMPEFYGKVPTKIDTYATDAAEAITP